MDNKYGKYRDEFGIPGKLMSASIVTFMVFHIITAGLFLRTRIGDLEKWPFCKD